MTLDNTETFLNLEGNMFEIYLSIFTITALVQNIKGKG
jgi:hypothetical protein